MFPPERLSALEPLIALLQFTEHWDKRYEVEWYVSRCIVAGFANTPDQVRLCAERYLAGKRKVTPPGTKRRKRDAKRMRDMMSNTPAELLAAVAGAIADAPRAVQQYLSGTEKALNALVGGVIKRYKTDPAVIRELLIQKLKT